MSYSTQREFFNVSFPNEDPKLPVRKRSDGAIMTYDFCTDGRAWALDSQKRSNYILDIVHKARFRKALMHPEGQFELSKDYLVTMDVDDLAEYVLSLQSEVKRKNDSVKRLEETKDALKEQLDSSRTVSDNQHQLQRQSAMLEQERNEFEQQMADLEEVIVNLKDRADRYDLLAKENELLRQQVQRQRIEAADKMRLVNAEAEASFNRMRAEDCDRLEAELIMYKTQYDELKQQKRELKEQLRRMQSQQSKVGELKRLLAMEQAQREQVEEEMEHLLELYDKQSQEVRRRSSATQATDHQPINQDVRHSLESRGATKLTPHQEENRSEEVVKTFAMEPTAVEDCANCKILEAELKSIKESQQKGSEQAEQRSKVLQDELEAARKQLSEMSKQPVQELPQTVVDSVDQQKLAQLTTQLQQYEADITALNQTRSALEEKIAAQETELAELHAKIAAETSEIEQLTQEMVALQKQTDELKGQLDAKDAALSSSGGAGEQLVGMQKMLDEARQKLAEKTQQLDAVNVEMQEKIKEQEDNQKSKDSELEAMKKQVEESQQKDVEQPLDTSELDNLKKTNEDLQREVAQLSEQLANAQELAKQLQQGAGDEAELLKSIANLREDLRVANEAIGAKETEIKQLLEEVETAKELAEEQAIKIAEESAKEEMGVEETVGKVESAIVEGEDELQAQAEEAELISGILGVPKVGETPDIVEKEKQKCAEEMEALKQELLKCREEKLFGKDDVENIEGQTDQEVDEVLEEFDAMIEEESVGTVVADESGEETEGKDDVGSLKPEEVGDGDGKEEIKSEDSLMLEIDTMEPCDGDRIRRIAIKIVRHGISILIWSELDYLHHEICKAMIYRFKYLDQNVQALDQSIETCNTIVAAFHSMQNNEMMAMVSSATQVPIRNALVLDDEIPIRLSPQKPKQKPRSSRTSVVPSEGQQVLSMFSKGLPAPAPVATPVSRSAVNKVKSRVLVDSEFGSRSRPWGPPPKTPTEAMIATTLPDGSRLMTRQKWH